MKNRISLVSLTVVLALSVGLVACASEEVPEVTEYTLTISSTEGGSVVTPGEGTGSFTYDEGEVVELMAEPDEGYNFIEWTGDVDTIADVNEAATTIAMNSNCVIIASFEEEAVTFADPDLEAVVRETISISTGPIYRSDLEGLTSLNGTERNITYLNGLEFCYNLAYLYLRYNQIEDLSPLANLTSLKELSLSGNQISSMSTLPNLINLTILDLEGNYISDISPLVNLTDLTHLNLGHTHSLLFDISPLANLTNLTVLDLEWNRNIGDISPLDNLTSLTYLNLCYTWTDDISPLANLTNLNWLDLDMNQISDISPLVNNPGLSAGDTVVLRNNPLSSTSRNIYIPQLEARGVIIE